MAKPVLDARRGIAGRFAVAKENGAGPLCMRELDPGTSVLWTASVTIIWTVARATVRTVGAAAKGYTSVCFPVRATGLRMEEFSRDMDGCMERSI